MARLYDPTQWPKQKLCGFLKLHMKYTPFIELFLETSVVSFRRKRGISILKNFFLYFFSSVDLQNFRKALHMYS